MYKSLLEHTLSLLVVFLLLCSAAVWTGRLFGHDIGPATTADTTRQAAFAAPDAEQLSRLTLDGGTVRLLPRDSASWTVSDADGSELGVVLSSEPYAQKIEGFAGPTPVFVYVDQAGRVVQTAAADNDETPDFFESAWNGTAPRWQGLTAAEAVALKVDAVSGATYSSTAIVRNVQQTLAAYVEAEGHRTDAPAVGWLRTAAVAVVLLLGVLAAWAGRGRKGVRVAVLLLNVGVTGFWCGQFLSLSLLRGWVANGLDPLLYLPGLLMLGVALLMPWLGRKRHYCNWVCPYGSLQELAARLPLLPKVPCGPRVFKWMRRVRMGVLAVLLLGLWTGVGAFVLDYEPFTAFMLASASPVVLVLAGTFVVASLFVPNLWCRCCCPVGALLDLSEDDKPTQDGPAGQAS